tara:strand:+ start:3687 stop:4295 length:609 start_codon:yes stop_codon:yes gene_type:complete
MKQKLTHVAMMPQARAAGTLSKLIEPIADDNGNVALAEYSDILSELVEETRKVRQNDLSQAGDALSAQAQVLDALFHKLAGMALSAEYLEHMKTYMLMALKAQSQSRNTWETLAEIKNPRPVFQQNNLAHNQQVNNRIGSSTHGKKSKVTNELLKDEGGRYETLDYGRAKAAIRVDQEMEAVDAFDRAKNIRGERESQDERP